MRASPEKMDIEELTASVAGRVPLLSGLYNRLLLIVGPVASGKTALIRKIAGSRADSPIDVGLELSGSMLQLTQRQRFIELPRQFEAILAKANSEIVFLDNIEVLFLPELQQDPLALLRNSSRNRTIVSTWLGRCEHNHLVYGAPEHREFRRYETHGLELVALSGSR